MSAPTGHPGWRSCRKLPGPISAAARALGARGRTDGQTRGERTGLRMLSSRAIHRGTNSIHSPSLCRRPARQAPYCQPGIQGAQRGSLSFSLCHSLSWKKLYSFALSDFLFFCTAQRGQPRRGNNSERSWFSQALPGRCAGETCPTPQERENEWHLGGPARRLSVCLSCIHSLTL